MISKFEIRMYLETIFNKNINNITREEMMKVQSIPITFSNLVEEDDSMNLSDISSLFPNLKSITIKNKIIFKEDIKDLSKLRLEHLYFDECSFYNDISLSSILNLTDLKMTNCKSLNYDFLKDLPKSMKRISINTPLDEKNIDIKYFLNYNNLCELYLEKCNIENLDFLINLKNLNILSLLWSNMDLNQSKNIFLTMNKLQTLYVSDGKENEELYKNVPSNIKIYHNLNHYTFSND